MLFNVCELAVAVALAPGRFGLHSRLASVLQPLAHVRFREEAERVDASGTAPSHPKLRAMDFAARQLAKARSVERRELIRVGR